MAKCLLLSITVNSLLLCVMVQTLNSKNNDKLQKIGLYLSKYEETL